MKRTHTPLKKPAASKRHATAKRLPTYAESIGDRSFNWFKALSAPKITRVEWKLLHGKASSWTTCACGNQCAILPRDDDGGPDDDRLYYLGITFYVRVRRRDRAGAIETLHAIEKRSAFLIAEQKLAERSTHTL